MKLRRARIGLLLVTWVVFPALLAGCAGRVAPTRQPAVPAERAAPAIAAETAAAPAGAGLLDGSARLPLNPEIRAGKLPNGMAYFVRPNRRPENRAEIWLALNAGSMQEDDDQLGLAHFVEHMAFNGTRNFEKQEITDFLESIGMRFGPDINAYTTFDETVYTLRVPTDDEEIVDKAFTILQDWAQGVTFEDEEIDAERGVVLEEWRLGRGAQARMRDEQFPVLFKDSRYAERLTIGKSEIIENAPYDVLRRYYRDWYRPELMALVAVGDFDPDAIEGKIRETFTALANPESTRERRVHPVPDHQETLWSIATDPEATSASVAIYYKLDKRPEGTIADYRRFIAEQLYHAMVNSRLNEIRQQPDPPFLFAGSASGGFVRSKDVYFQYAQVEDRGLERGLDALLTEVRRVDRHGFTQSELDRQKKDLLRGYEQAYRERDKRRSSGLADEILRHFLSGEPIPGIGYELELVRAQLPTITLDEINDMADEWISDRNRVILVNAPEKDGVDPPQQESLQPVFEAAARREVEPYLDEVRDEPLLANKPAAGSIVEESRIEELDLTEWRLSNGVRVVMRPTDFQNDVVRLTGLSPGGHSLVSDDDHTSATFASSVLRAGGLGEFSRVELQKALAGKVASASASFSEHEESASGSASPQDLETMFELLYLSFTAPRKDEEAFQSWLQRTRASIENRLSRPETVFSDKLRQVLSQEHHRRRPVSNELLDEIDLDAALRIYRERLGDAGDFTFVIVGNFDPGEIRPLVLAYLGGLPAAGREESWRDVHVHAPEEVVRFEVRQGLEPKSSVRIVFNGPAEWGRQESHDLTSLAGSLRIRLREVLREDMGGTYGVRVGGGISRRPRQEYSFSISFGCAPENVESLTQAVWDEIDNFRENGVDEEVVIKVQESQRRRRETDLRENGFWLYGLANAYRYGEDPRSFLDYDPLVDSVSSERIRAAALRYLNRDRYVLGVLYPETDTAAATE